MEIIGNWNKAKIFTEDVEESALSQIKALCNEETFFNSKIRIMPDVHAGVGCVIGTTMTITDRVVPNLVGVDIGCGMAVRIYDKMNIDFQKFDEIVKNKIPSGFAVHGSPILSQDAMRIDQLRMFSHLDNVERIYKSLGTLGGGNHFIELNEYEDKIYLVIHSGSRNLGKQVAEYYQKIAKEKNGERCSKELEYLDGNDLENYLYDMDIAQKFAYANREEMMRLISLETGWKHVDELQTIHNYIDMGSMILRKGAISAKKGERVIIPINMRDGSIIAYGKGNDDWNNSAPHGAGRVMGRNEAKRKLDIGEFESTMQNVWSSTVNLETIDEAPMAYKTIDSIINNVDATITIDKIIKPIYNFKASEKRRK